MSDARPLTVDAVGVSVTEAMACGLPRPCRVMLPSRPAGVIWQDFGPGFDDSRPRQDLPEDMPPGPALAHPLMPLAEGIEMEAEAEICREMGFQLIQGYLTGKPIPVDSLWRIRSTTPAATSSNAQPTPLRPIRPAHAHRESS